MLLVWRHAWANAAIPSDGSICQYKMDGYEIDLSKVGAPTDDAKDTNKYFYNPCQSFDMSNEASVTYCKQVVICQHEENSELHALGTLKSAVDMYNQTNQFLLITYNATEPQSHSNCTNGMRVATVKVSCSPNRTGDFRFIDEKPRCYYQFELNTKYARRSEAVKPHGLGVGAVLLIIFFICIALYLIGGMTYKGCVSGERGVNMIPNIEFWKQLPGLIKDGCLFVVKPCRGPSAYDEI